MTAHEKADDRLSKLEEAVSEMRDMISQIILGQDRPDPLGRDRIEWLSAARQRSRAKGAV